MSENRMAGMPLKNLRIFEGLCGENSFENVILTTTMWDNIDEETGEDRERELKSKYWRNMLDHGSTTGRFMRTRESAFNLIYPLIDAANKRNSVLLQRELVDIGKKLSLTSAGQALLSEMEVLVRKRQDLLVRIRNEMKRADGDKMTLEALEEEYERIRNSLEAIANDMRRLKLSLEYRLVNMITSISNSNIKSLRSIFNLRRRIDRSPSIDVKNPNTYTALTTDSYVSDPQSMDPESEENLPQPGPGPKPIAVVEDPIDSRRQLPILNLSSRASLPKSILPQADDQPTTVVKDSIMTTRQLSSTTEEHAQDNAASQTPQNKTTPADSLSLDKSLPPSVDDWQRPDPTRSDSQAVHSRLSTTKKHHDAQDDPMSKNPQKTESALFKGAYVLPVDEQGPEPTGSESQIAYSSSSTTEEHAQDSAKPTSTADPLSEVRDISFERCDPCANGTPSSVLLDSTLSYPPAASMSAHYLFLCIGTQKLEVRYLLCLQNFMIIAFSFAMHLDTIFSLCCVIKFTGICVFCTDNLRDRNIAMDASLRMA
jgi:hypothetical protein